MKYIYSIAALFITICIGTAACQNVSDTLGMTEQVTALKADSLYYSFVSNHQDIADRIARGEIDITGASATIDRTRAFDFCDPDPKLLTFRGWDYYTEARCRHIVILNEIKAKYPFVNELTREEWQQLFYPQRHITEEEWQEIRFLNDLNKY